MRWSLTGFAAAWIAVAAAFAGEGGAVAFIEGDGAASRRAFVTVLAAIALTLAILANRRREAVVTVWIAAFHATLALMLAGWPLATAGAFAVTVWITVTRLGDLYR